MQLLTQPQVRELALQAGFVPGNARIASAIAMCEAPYMENGVAFSNFSAIGDQHLATDKWGYSYGGFQIRSLRADKGTGRWRDEDRLLEPAFNIQAARQIKLAQGWEAWSTFTSGMYKAYMPEVYPPPVGSYIVVGGDTLSKIAVKFEDKFTWQQLAMTNNMRSPYTIQIGQVLILPTGA